MEQKEKPSAQAILKFEEPIHKKKKSKGGGGTVLKLK
jgi:hypothetical protein